MALRYLLDTNILAEPTRPAPDPGVLERLRIAGDTVATAAPVWHELEYGLARLPRGRRRTALERFFGELEGALSVLPYDREAAGWHARERARLSKRGAMPAFVDGQIAAVAAVRGLVVVTRNVRDFELFGGLHVESWFRDATER